MLVGIHDALRVRHRIARQVVVGHQDLHTQTLRFSHSFHAGDTVIHGEQDVWRRLFRQTYDLGGQSVTELKTIRHDEVDSRAERTQSAHPDGTGRCTIRIVISHDQQFLLCGDCIRQQRSHFFRIHELAEGEQMLDVCIKLLSILYTSCRIDACQQRRDAGGFEL